MHRQARHAQPGIVLARASDATSIGRYSEPARRMQLAREWMPERLIHMLATPSGPGTSFVSRQILPVPSVSIVT